ncbi:MAG TPA: hypothetical protein VIM71_12040 [Lacunisphaera sp.]
MKILAAALILTFVSLGASAQSIGVDFNSDASAANHDVNDPGNGISPTYSGKGVLGESFTGINAGGKGVALSDGVTMDITCSQGDASFRDQPPADGDGPAADLFRDYIQADHGQSLTITIHGLKPKTAYQVVVYGASTRAGSDQTAISGAVTGTLTGTNADGSRVSRTSFVKDANYIQGKAVANDSGDLTFTATSTNGGWPVVNGFGLAADSTVSK